MPYDALLNDIQVQQQATPVAPYATLEKMAENFDVQKPNGVVMGKAVATRLS